MAHYEQLALVSRGLQLRCSLHACCACYPPLTLTKKITLHLPFCQQCQARVLTLLFVRSSFSYLLLAHVFLINKKLERASIRAIQLETVHVYEQRVALEWEFSFPLPLSRHLFLYLFTIFIVWMVKYY